MSLRIPLIIVIICAISGCVYNRPCDKYRDYDYQAEYLKSPYIDRVREDLTYRDTTSKDSITFDNDINVDMKRIYKYISYPEVTRCLWIEGKNIFKLLIDEKGYITKKIFDIKNLPILEDEALRAIIKAQPYPVAIVDDKPTEYWLNIPVKFELN